MRRYGYVALMMLCVWALSSCSKSNEDDVIDEVWKLQNEEAFLAKKGDASFMQVESPGNEGFIFMRRIEKGADKRVFFTSRVEVYYKGSLINGTVFDKRSLLDGQPFKAAVSSVNANYNSSTGTGYGSVIPGWTIALQQMCEGDKWEVWIPQKLAYGTATDNAKIPAYSTLVFEIEVLKVIHINEY